MALALRMKEEDLAMAEIEEPRCNGAAVRREMVEPRKIEGREGQGMKVNSRADRGGPDIHPNT